MRGESPAGARTAAFLWPPDPREIRRSPRTAAPAGPGAGRDGREYVVELVVGDVVYLRDAEGQMDAAHIDNFRPLYEVAGARVPPPSEGVEDFIARTIAEQRR